MKHNLLLFLIYMLVFSISWLISGYVRRYAISSNLLDIPNERSSHVIPTPRGGGVSFVLCFIFCLILFQYVALITIENFYQLLIASLMVAILGYLDDRYTLSAKYRLIGHFIASCLVVFFLFDFTNLSFLNHHAMISHIGQVITIFYLVWLVNLFNFMDGIDGIAAAETICICLAGACFYFLHGDPEQSIAPLLLASAVGGFLLWNFPPARLFMGDVGSGFLGMCIGLMSIQASFIDEKLFFCWVIMTGIFITDATMTLLIRGINGKPLFEAHRTHAYQHMAKEFGQHRIVTISVILMNLLWLFPIAVLVELEWLGPIIGLLLAYIPLLFIVIKFKAGNSATLG